MTRSKLRAITYLPEEYLYNNIDDYLIFKNIDQEKYALVGLAAAIHHFKRSFQLGNVLEILGGVGLYSRDLVNTFPGCVCKVADSNEKITSIGRKLNSHLEFIDKSLILNHNSQDIIFTSVNFLSQLHEGELRASLEDFFNLLKPGGFVFSEMDCKPSLSMDYMKTRKVKYEGANLKFISLALEYSPLLDSYTIGNSLWNKGELVNAYMMQYFNLSLRACKLLAEEVGFVFEVCTYDLAEYADQVQFETLTVKSRLDGSEPLVIKLTKE